MWEFFYLAQFEYTKYENSDCSAAGLPEDIFNNVGYQPLSMTADSCESICNKFGRCGGFTFHTSENRCYMKDLLCRNNISSTSGVTTYIKEGWHLSKYSTQKYEKYINNSSTQKL